MNKKYNNKGFTLLEVLVALTVAAIALTVLVQGLSHYANQFIHLQQSTIARNMGSSYLTRKILEPEYILPEFVDNAGKTWELRYSEDPYFFRGMENLKKVTLLIFDDKERQVTSLHVIVRDKSDGI